MTLLYVTHPGCLEHDPKPAHPECGARLLAARIGLDRSGVDARLVVAEAAPRALVARVHDASVMDALEALDARGGGMIDPDTFVSAGTRNAAELAAGSALTAVSHIDAGVATRAFCAVRPPGHHATPSRSMGFCFYNSIAIAATMLRDRGERVAIVDLDAHHGNGTEEVFSDDADVLFASIHQWPFYPGTGALEDIGRGSGVGTTINIPVPAGTTGDHYRDALERVVVPALTRLAPTWLLLSLGFDAHRDDPLTALGLTSGDYADLVTDLLQATPHAKVVALLEGGYDLDAVQNGVHATVTAFAGAAEHPERPTSGGRGRDAVDAAVRQHRSTRW